MEIILLENIQNLGTLGDTVTVANGYARNFLIPQKKAVIATVDAKALVDVRRRELATEESKRVEVARARADIGIRAITLSRLAGEGGKLYGSVSPTDIADALTEAGCRTEKSEILQPDGPIKQTGEFTADVLLHPEVRFSVKVTVLGEGDDDRLTPAQAAQPGQASEPGPDEPINPTDQAAQSELSDSTDDATNAAKANATNTADAPAMVNNQLG